MAIDGVTHIDPAQVRELGDRLSVDADVLRAAASGLDRQVPPVPFDEVGLAGLLVRYDEAREAFDRRVADIVDGAGERAILQVLDASRADASVPYTPLPESAR